MTDDQFVCVARRNLRYFIGAALFKCEADREAAINCLDAIEAENERLQARVAELEAGVREIVERQTAPLKAPNSARACDPMTVLIARELLNKGDA